jgi:hypothetical protein
VNGEIGPARNCFRYSEVGLWALIDAVLTGTCLSCCMTGKPEADALGFRVCYEATRMRLRVVQRLDCFHEK